MQPRDGPGWDTVSRKSLNIYGSQNCGDLNPIHVAQSSTPGNNLALPAARPAIGRNHNGETVCYFAKLALR